MSRQRILVVDDTPENIDVLGGILRQDYEVRVATNGERALKVAAGEPRPDMILLDIMMPGMDGYEVCRRLKDDPATATIPVIFVTAKDDPNDEEMGLELGAVDYITKPISPAIVRARVRSQLAIHDQNRELARQVSERTAELRETRLKIIQRLACAAEIKDYETGMHVVRMSHYARLIAQAYGGSEEWLEMLFQASSLHDIGKIGLPDGILQKAGELTPEEWVLVRKHTLLGAEIIGHDDNPLLRMAHDIALTHHERWDGSGYPHGLSAEQIPLEGRIVAIADVFDALTTERPYRPAWSHEAAARHIEERAGSQFDPQLVPLFLQVLPQLQAVRHDYEGGGLRSAREILMTEATE